MGKVSGAYESVVRGVSQQVAQDRRPGQHWEQVNMISDPVRGLARRHGSQLMDEMVIGSDPTAWTGLLASTAHHRTFSFFVDGKEYDLICRRDASGSPSSSNFCWAYSKADRTFIPVVLNSGDSVVNALVAGGASALVNVGKYVFIGGNTIVPSYTFHDAWGDSSNTQRLLAWVRGGAYSRTYTITLTKADGTKLTASYTTMASSYQTLLDTSDILASDPEYQKKVNDRLNAYNAAVTAYIGQAAEDIVPANIAAKLQLAVAAAGFGGVMTRADSSLLISSTDYVEITCDDGGDGSLFRGVGNTIRDVDSVSSKHLPGKIVKVRPTKNDATDTIYLKAVARDGVSTGLTDVTWTEGAGYVMTPVSPFCIATVHAGTFYIAGTPAGLTTLVGEAVPAFKSNQIGDQLSCPLPYFVGRSVDYLGLMQDRLVIGSGAVLFFSKPGDYFNWFRATVLDVEDNDPIEIYALGSEDDTIRTATTFDRNMLLFGDRKQYTVDGTQQLKPSTASVVIMSANENATDAWPVAAGNFVFYSQVRNGVASAHQFQVGQLLDSPESYQISEQLDRYMLGTPIELVAVTTPNMVLMRTDGVRNVIYTYSYLDSANGYQRLFDSWSKWSWNDNVGQLVGISSYLRDVLIYRLRQGVDKDGHPKIWIACDKQVLDSQLSSTPYLDSWRMSSNVLTPDANSFISTASTFEGSDVWFAYGNDGTDNAFLGSNLTNLSLFLEQYEDAPSNTYAGFDYDTYVTPTNPYVRDSSGKPVLTGRMVLGRLNISLQDTGGIQVTVATPNTTYMPLNFSGRQAGRAANRVGRAPIVTTTVGALVGREIRECTYTLRAVTFLPLTIATIEWAGQLFNNVQRVTS